MDICRDVGFVHLHVHSSYSLREGALTIAKLAKLAIADDQPVKPKKEDPDGPKPKKKTARKAAPRKAAATKAAPKSAKDDDSGKRTTVPQLPRRG